MSRRILELRRVACEVRLRLLFRRHALRHRGFRLLELRRIAPQVGLGLAESRLQGALVQREEQIALFDLLALQDVDAGDLSIQLALERHARIRLYRADRADLDRGGLADRGIYGHRDSLPRRGPLGLGFLGGPVGTGHEEGGD